MWLVVWLGATELLQQSCNRVSCCNRAATIEVAGGLSEEMLCLVVWLGATKALRPQYEE